MGSVYRAAVLTVDGPLLMIMSATSEVTTLWAFWRYGNESVIIIIIRPHCSTTYADAAYCYWPSGVVVCLSVCYTSEPCKNGWTDRDAVWVVCLDGLKELCYVLRDVAMATNFWLSMGYTFGCMIASDTLFDCRGGFSTFQGQAIRWRHSRDRMSKVVAIATNFGTKIAITGFVWMIATRQLVMEGGLSGRPTKCRYCQYPATEGRCHSNHFCLSVYGIMDCTLAPSGEYDWIVCVLQRYGLMSNYFDHLL